MEVELKFHNPKDKTETLELGINRENYWGGVKYKMKLKFKGGRTATSRDVFITDKSKPIEFYLDDKNSLHPDFTADLEPNNLFTPWYNKINKMTLIAGGRRKEFHFCT